MTIAISLLILSFFTILLINANSVVESLRDRVEMEAFLRDGLTRSELDSIRIGLLDASGVRDVAFISKDSASAIFREGLKMIAAGADMLIMRHPGAAAKAKALIAANASEDQILDAMIADPILIERPLVETDKGARLCRPQEKVLEIL